MNGFLAYKGFIGSVEYSIEDKILFGQVLGLEHTSISYEGKKMADLTKDFREAVDFHIECCEESGELPEIPFSKAPERLLA